MRNNPWNFTTIPLSNDDNDIDNDNDNNDDNNDNNDDDNDNNDDDNDNGSDDDDNDNDSDNNDNNDDDGGFPNWTIQFNCLSVSSVGNLKKNDRIISICVRCNLRHCRRTKLLEYYTYKPRDHHRG